MNFATTDIWYSYLALLSIATIIVVIKIGCQHNLLQRSILAQNVLPSLALQLYTKLYAMHRKLGNPKDPKGFDSSNEGVLRNYLSTLWQSDTNGITIEELTCHSNRFVLNFKDLKIEEREWICLPNCNAQSMHSCLVLTIMDTWLSVGFETHAVYPDKRVRTYTGTRLFDVTFDKTNARVVSTYICPNNILAIQIIERLWMLNDKVEQCQAFYPNGVWNAKNPCVPPTLGGHKII